MRKVFILRGISGSGKSTWASNFQQSVHAEKYGKFRSDNRMVYIFSADNFFVEYVDGKEEYNFDASKLGEAHAECLKKYDFLVSRIEVAGQDTALIVDNTNTSVAEISPYYALAEAYGWEAEIKTFYQTVEKAAKENVHGTPIEVIMRQENRLREEEKRFPPWWIKTSCYF